MSEKFEQDSNNSEKEKRPPLDITRICNPETGLTGDYLNEVGRFRNAADGYTDEELMDLMKRRSMQHYDVRYESYLNVVTDQNRENISKINAVVDEINSTTDPKMLRIKILQFYRDFYKLVWNKEL